MTNKCKTCMHGYPNVECVNCGTGFRDYLPYTPPTNADRIRCMSDEELATEITKNPSIPCRMCEYYNHKLGHCDARRDFACVTAYAEALALDWLRQPAKEERHETD